MDLLGDLGTQDQLTAARAENAVLHDKVAELSALVKQLQLDKATLQARLEIEQQELVTLRLAAARLQFQSASPSTNPAAEPSNLLSDMWITAGNGQYPQHNLWTWWSSSSSPSSASSSRTGPNLLSCALSLHAQNDGILAWGTALGQVQAGAWDLAAAETSSLSSSGQPAALTVETWDCGAPVVSLAFGPTQPLLAAGTMDGSVHVTSYAWTRSFFHQSHHEQYKDTNSKQSRIRLNLRQAVNTSQLKNERDPAGLVSYRHGKYVRCVAWSTSSSSNPLLATASADGTVHIYQVSTHRPTTFMSDDDDHNDDDDDLLIPQLVPCQSLYLGQAVESLAFGQDSDQLLVYARNTPYLQVFDVQQGWHRSTINLNTLPGGSPGAGGFEDHVSFAVMDLKPWPRHASILALATDQSRHLILDVRQGGQGSGAVARSLRQLYGHVHDGYSHPKVAWSNDGQYLLGNTHDDGALCVWELASGRLVSKCAGHAQPIRDLVTSPFSDVAATVSLDKTARLWYGPEHVSS